MFSPDGLLVVSTSDGNTFRLWDSSTGAKLQTLEGHSDLVHFVLFSPDGKLVVSTSDGNTLWLWDLSTGAKLQTLEGHLDLVYSVVFSPDGKLVASASADSTVRLWDLSTGAVLRTYMCMAPPYTTRLSSRMGHILKQIMVLWVSYLPLILLVLLISELLLSQPQLVSVCKADGFLEPWEASFGFLLTIK